MSPQRAPGGGRVWSAALGVGLVVVLLSGCVVGQGQWYSADKFPDPLQDPYTCNSPRGEPSLICDPSKYLTEFQHDELQAILKSIRMRGTCPCTDEYSCDTSYTVALAIVPALSTSGGLAQARSSLLEFAKTLQASMWQHGNCGENVVIAYSVGDNIIEASFGEQARAKLEDECRDEIQGKVDDYLRNGQIFEGLHLMAREYSEYFNGERTCSLPSASSPLEGVYVVLIFMCVVIFFGLAYFFIVSFRKCSQGEMLRNPQPHAHQHQGPKVHIGPAAHPTVHHGHIGPAVVPGHHTGGVAVVNSPNPVMGGGAMGTAFSLPYADGMDMGGNSVSNITIGGDDSGAW